MKLGCVPSRHDERTLNLRTYLTSDPQIRIPARDWTTAVKQFGVWKNDVLGDCTCASMAHVLQAQAANTGNPLTITDDDVVGLYKLTGYDPDDPKTDQGAQLIDVLKLMRSHGLAGNKLGAFAKVDHRNMDELDAAVNLCGFAYTGSALPRSILSQTVWDVVDGPDGVPGSLGNHAMAMLGFDDKHAVLISWGQVRVATREWCQRHMFEAWAGIDALWLEPGGVTPSGFDVTALARDLAEIGKVHS